METNDHDIFRLKLLFDSGENTDSFQRQLTDFFPAIVYVYDAGNKRLQYINKKVTEVLGYSYDDIKGWNDDVFNLVFKDDVDQVKKELEKYESLKDEDNYSFNCRLNHKKGDWRYFRTQGTVLRRDDSGKPSSLLFIAQDVTDTFELTEKNKKLEELFSETQEMLQYGMWEWNIAKNKMTWSDGLYKLLDYDPVKDKDTLELTPAFYDSHIAPEDQARIVAETQKHIAENKDYEQYYTIISHKGIKKNIHEKGKMVTDENGALVKVIGSTRDITDQLKVQDQLMQHKKQMDEKEEYLGYGSWQYDTITRLVTWSEGMYRLFGYDPHTDSPNIVVNEALYYQHILEEDQQAVTQQFKKFLSENTEYTLQYRILTKDGTLKVLESQGKILPGANGNTQKVIGTTRDVTKIAKYEKNLEAIIKDLNRSNKELEEFAYIASHDLQEPLRKLSTFSERLVSKYTDAFDQEGKLYIQRILAATENMRILIDNLLEFSRTTRPSMPFEKTDLNVILSNAISTLEVGIENANAVINKKEELPVIEAIPTQMEQLFINLVGNAVKFHKPGMQVIIDISAEKLAPAEIEKLNLDTEKKYYKIELRDNGIGFEQEYAERIFQIFQRLHGKVEFPGSGVGLAICKKIVENHGGAVYADSIPDNGAVFTIVLPETQQ